MPSTEHETRGSEAIRLRMARLREEGFRVTQYDLAKCFNRGQTWVSNYLLRDADAALRHLWSKDPSGFEEALACMLSTLRWSPNMFRERTGILIPVEQTRTDTSDIVGLLREEGERVHMAGDEIDAMVADFERIRATGRRGLKWLAHALRLFAPETEVKE